MNNVRENIEKIKRLNEHFINEKLMIMEKLGVGDNVVETAKEIFNKLITTISDKSLSRFTLNDNAEQPISIDGPFFIGKISSDTSPKTFETIKIVIEYFKTKNKTKISFAGAQVLVQSKQRRDTENKYKAYFIRTVPKIIFKIAGPNNSISLFELKEFLEGEQQSIVSTMAHELMHLFEKEILIDKNRGKSIYDIINYHIYNEMYTDIPPFNELIFLLYYGDKIEQITRPTELLAYLTANNVTKKNFKEEVKKTRMFENLTRMKNLTFEHLMTSLKTEYADKINNLTVEKNAQDYYDNANIDEKILFLLTFLIKIMQKKAIEKFTDILFFELIWNGASEDLGKYQRGFDKTGEIVKNFWIKEIKKINRIGDKQLRKIFKLYDMMPDDPKTNDNLNDDQNVNPNNTQSNSISSIQEWELNMEIRKIKKIFS